MFGTMLAWGLYRRANPTPVPYEPQTYLSGARHNPNVSESAWEGFKEGVEDIFEFLGLDTDSSEEEDPNGFGVPRKKDKMQKQWAGVKTAPPWQKPPEKSKKPGFKHFTLNVGEKAKKYTKRKVEEKNGFSKF